MIFSFVQKQKNKLFSNINLAFNRSEVVCRKYCSRSIATKTYTISKRMMRFLETGNISRDKIIASPNCHIIKFNCIS